MAAELGEARHHLAEQAEELGCVKAELAAARAQLGEMDALAGSGADENGSREAVQPEYATPEEWQSLNVIYDLSLKEIKAQAKDWDKADDRLRLLIGFVGLISTALAAVGGITGTVPADRELAWAQARYTAVLAADGSTLDALLRQVGLLRDLPDQPLAGRMLALLDVGARLPRALWYEADPQVHDQRFWPQLVAAVPAGALLLLDLGFT